VCPNDVDPLQFPLVSHTRYSLESHRTSVKSVIDSDEIMACAVADQHMSSVTVCDCYPDEFTAMEELLMQQAINIKLCRHDREENWSVDVAGNVHQLVSTDPVHGLGEYGVVAAQRAILECETPLGVNDQQSSV
jgi:hypothetical protein